MPDTRASLDFINTKRTTHIKYWVFVHDDRGYISIDYISRKLSDPQEHFTIEYFDRQEGAIVAMLGYLSNHDIMYHDKTNNVWILL